jgi:hypothetical protein
VLSLRKNIFRLEPTPSTVYSPLEDRREGLSDPKAEVETLRGIITALDAKISTFLIKESTE